MDLSYHTFMFLRHFNQMDPIIVFGVAGLLLGIVLSAVFGVYSKKTTVSYVRSIFGYSSNSLITDIIVFVLAATIIVLSVVSALVRDLRYPIAKPVHFTVETLLMGFLPACVFIAMTYLRGYTFNTTRVLEFFLLFAKFGILHILLQFSGFYSEVFPPN